MKRIRRLFIRGLFSILPIVTTIYIIYFLFSSLDNFFGTFIRMILKRIFPKSDGNYPGLGVIASLALIFLMGFFVSNVIGKKLFEFAERMLHKIPLVPKVYFAIKQIIEAFSLQGNKVFSQVVLVEYPRKEVYVVGFLTGECKGEIKNKIDKKLMNVFVPTTPNPTSGMLIMVPNDEITYLDMTVEDGLKLIVSAGVVVNNDIKELTK